MWELDGGASVGRTEKYATATSTHVYNTVHVMGAKGHPAGHYDRQRYLSERGSRGPGDGG